MLCLDVNVVLWESCTVSGCYYGLLGVLCCVWVLVWYVGRVVLCLDVSKVCKECCGVSWC